MVVCEKPSRSDSPAQERITQDVRLRQLQLPTPLYSNGPRSVLAHSIKFYKGWSDSRFVCVCGFKGNFRGGKGIAPYCPVCGQPGFVGLDDTYVRQGLKSPLRKFKGRCAKCGVPCAGKVCWEHNDHRAPWDLAKCREQSFILARSWLAHPELRKNRRVRGFGQINRVGGCGRFSRKPNGWLLVEEVRRQGGVVNGLLEERNNRLSKTVKKMGNATEA